MPTKAIEMPIEQINRYFHVASSEASDLLKYMRYELDNVVASTNTQSSTRCVLSMTPVMVAANIRRLAEYSDLLLGSDRSCLIYEILYNAVPKKSMESMRRKNTFSPSVLKYRVNCPGRMQSMMDMARCTAA